MAGQTSAFCLADTSASVDDQRLAQCPESDNKAPQINGCLGHSHDPSCDKYLGKQHYESNQCNFDRVDCHYSQRDHRVANLLQN